MFRRPALIAALLVTPILAPSLRAQSAAERQMLVAWDESVQRVTAASGLAAWDGASRHGSGRAGDVRRALFQVRQADLTDDRNEIELVLTNMAVMATHTGWAWPEYVMARAFQAMARRGWVETLSDGKEPGERHIDALWRTLRTALDRDSTLPPARQLLARLTSAQGDRFLRPDQELALARETRQLDADPDALLAWGRHLRTLREYRSALTAFQMAIDQGGDRSRLELELARTLVAVGDTGTAIYEYWDGLQHLTATGREMYRFDLAWFTDSATLAAFDRLADSAVTPWLHRFWSARDAEAADHPGDRLREQLRRWVVAMERYRALSPWNETMYTRVEYGFDYAPGDAVVLDATPPPPGAPMGIKAATCTEMDPGLYEQLWRMQPSHPGDMRRREPLLDHRGLVYLRNGEPQRRIDGWGADGGGLLGGVLAPAKLPGASSGPARGPHGVLLPWSDAGLGEAPDHPTEPLGESWIYGLAGTWHVLQFRGSDALGTYAATTLTGRVPSAWLADPRVEATIPGAIYVALEQRIGNNEASPMRRAVRDAIDAPTCFRETMAAAAETRADEHFFIDHDTDTPPGLRPSNSVYQAFALGTAADHSGEALVTFALDPAVLRAERLADGTVVYPVSFYVVADDQATDRTITLDTVRRFARPAPITAGQYLTADLEMALPAGTWHVAARIGQLDGSVVINDARTIRVDRLAPLALSDIVTGRPGSPAWRATDRADFPVNYTNAWRPGEVAELFFEVRGVPAGKTYRTAIVVRPVDPRARTAIRIESTDPASGPVTYVRKSLGMEQLTPGTYILQLTVDFAGATAVRERRVLIVPGP